MKSYLFHTSVRRRPAIRHLHQRRTERTASGRLDQTEIINIIIIITEHRTRSTHKA